MKNRTDNLEDFFHTAFNDEEKLNQPANWNEPSDAVWENIQSGLQEERRFSLVLLKWPWSAIAASYLLFMSGYSFFQSNANDDLVNSIVKTEQNISEELVENISISSINESTSITQSNGFVYDEKEVNNNTEPQNNLLVAAPQLLSMKRSGVKAESIDNQLVVSGVGSGVLNEIFKPTVSISTLKPQLSIATNEPSLPTYNLVLPKQKKSKKYLAANYGSVVEKLTSSSTEYTADKLMYGNTFGVQIGQENAKGWAIETGVQYTKIGERVVQNSNEDQLKIAATNYLDLPVTVKKNWKKGKLGVNVKTGLVNRFEINQMTQSNSEVIADNHLQPNKYLPSVVAGVGLEYNLQPKLSLYVESSVSKGIKPVIDVEGMELTAENLMVQVGVRYEL